VDGSCASDTPQESSKTEHTGGEEDDDDIDRSPSAFSGTFWIVNHGQDHNTKQDEARQSAEQDHPPRMVSL